MFDQKDCSDVTFQKILFSEVLEYLKYTTIIIIYSEPSDFKKQQKMTTKC